VPEKGESETASDLERRIQLLEDRAAIQELLHRYSWLLDGAKFEEVVGLFTEDAVADYGALGVFRGPAEVRRFYCEMLPSTFTDIRHYLHNSTVELAGDHAHGRAYFELKTVTRARQAHDWAGLYHDEYALTGGRWKFRTRKIDFDYCLPEGKTWAEKERFQLDFASLGDAVA
jgi:ketosteroid isomerase-like protein